MMIMTLPTIITYTEQRDHYHRFIKPVHTSDTVDAMFDFVTNTVELVYQKISFFLQSRMLLRHCCRCRQQRRNKLNMFNLF